MVMDVPLVKSNGNDLTPNLSKSFSRQLHNNNTLRLCFLKNSQVMTNFDR